MHIQSAASAVLNTAPPGGAAAGFVADGVATGDALSPFSGVLENLLQPGALGAPSSAQDGAAAPTLAVKTDTAAIAGAAQTTTPAGSLASLTPKTPYKAGPGDWSSIPTGASDDQDAPLASSTTLLSAGLLSAGAQPKSSSGVADAPSSQPSSKSRTAKAAQDQTDAGQAGIQPVNLPLAALVAPSQPTLSPQGTGAPDADVQRTDAPTQGARGQGELTASLAKPNAAAPSPASIGPGAPSLKAEAQSADQLAANQTDAGQTASTDGQAQASATVAPTASTPQGFSLPTSQTAQAPAAASQAPIAAQSSTTQQPSAVAQFTGRSRAGAPTTVGGARTASTATRGASTGLSSGGAAGVWSAGLATTNVKVATGSSSSPDVEVATAVADAQSSGQDAQTSGQDASADAAPTADAGALSTLAATVQTVPSGDVAPDVRTASDTVANLSAQIAQKAGGQTTRFDVQLDPNGLGRVNVSVEINAKGALSAALSFEKPEAASLLKSHSAELQQSLTQAGFDLSNATISFSAVDQDGRGGQGQTAFLGSGADGNGGQQSQGGHAQNAGRAFGAASLAADQTDRISSASRGLSARGLDIRI